jgi:hypothetical protein
VGVTFFAAVEQRPADIVFQTLDLLTDGGLGAMDPLAGAREAAAIDHRNETPQKLQPCEPNFDGVAHLSFASTGLL